MNKLAAGGRAVIIKSRFPENVGAVVVLIRRWDDSELYPGSASYLVETEQRLKGSVKDVPAGGRAIVPEWGIAPISDPRLHEKLKAATNGE